MAKNSCFEGPVNNSPVTGTNSPSGSVVKNGVKSIGGRTLESRSKSANALDEVTFSTQNRVAKPTKE